MKRLKRRKILAFLLIVGVLSVGVIILLLLPQNEARVNDIIQEVTEKTVKKTPTPMVLPQSHIIPQQLHVFQSFNNCGPATLSMALSYMGITKDQSELGKILRPYQIPGGDNDDKSVTLEEVADQATEYGLVSYLKPNGDMQKIKQFVANDIPVVARTWTKVNEDIGHFRIVRGYDDATKEIIQDDSLQGKNLRYSYEEFEKLWVPFNFEYLVLVTPDKKQIAEEILGKDLEEKTAWQNAKVRIEKELLKDPNNIHLNFALSRIYYYLGDYEHSVEQFDKVEAKLSFRTLWYQIEPIQALYNTGDYDRTLALTQKILSNQNKAFTELYIIRGDIYTKQEKSQQAKDEYEKAVLYNENNSLAKEKLESIR